MKTSWNDLYVLSLFAREDAKNTSFNKIWQMTRVWSGFIHKWQDCTQRSTKDGIPEGDADEKISLRCRMLDQYSTLLMHIYMRFNFQTY